MFSKFLHITLAFYLTMLSGGIVFNKHYCGEVLESISVYLEADACCDREEPMEGCCHEESAIFCLEEEFFNKSTLTVESASIFQLTIPEFTFLISLFNTSVTTDLTRLFNYAPPLIIPDILVEVQSFLL